MASFFNAQGFNGITGRFQGEITGAVFVLYSVTLFPTLPLGQGLFAILTHPLWANVVLLTAVAIMLLDPLVLHYRAKMNAARHRLPVAWPLQVRLLIFLRFLLTFPLVFMLGTLMVMYREGPENYDRFRNLETVLRETFGPAILLLPIGVGVYWFISHLLWRKNLKKKKVQLPENLEQMPLWKRLGVNLYGIVSVCVLASVLWLPFQSDAEFTLELFYPAIKTGEAVPLGVTALKVAGLLALVLLPVQLPSLLDELTLQYQRWQHRLRAAGAVLLTVGSTLVLWYQDAQAIRARPVLLTEAPAQKTYLAYDTRSMRIYGGLEDSLPVWYPNLQTLSFATADSPLAALPGWVQHLGRLQTLRLPGHGLQQLPSWLGTMDSLQLLDLSGNRIRRLHTTRALPPNLQLLDLSGNPLQALPDTHYFPRSLRELYLANLDLADLGNLPWFSPLERLYFNKNALDRLPPEQGQTLVRRGLLD